MEQKQVAGGADATERIFERDSHRQEFSAAVRLCEETKEGYRVTLDRTAFFPEGGGQAGDSGWLDHIRVLDTKEKNGVIWHLLEPLPGQQAADYFYPGRQVTGKLDFARRFDRMQQHSGEHIVSGIVHRLHGYENVGFHLGEEITTLDFNGELSEAQVQKIEFLANQAVFANLPVEVLYPSKEELKTMEYRSKIEIQGQVRIVKIGDVDVCACCAPHVAQTGEIGLIKIIGCERHRGGCRMTMLAGGRALADYSEKQQSVTAVSVALCARPDQIAQAVQHLKEQQQKLREQLNRMQEAHLASCLASLSPQAHTICIFEEELDNIAARNFINEAMERCSGICGAFIGTDEGGYHYILGSSQADTREAAKTLNAAFAGKGGGSSKMVQGSLKGKKEAIEALLLQL